MSFGFGATYGNGTTDKIVTSYTRSLSPGRKRTYFVRFMLNGSGGGTLGRLYDKRTVSAESELVYFNSSDSRLRFLQWYSTVGVWQLDQTISTGVWYDLMFARDASALGNPLYAALNGALSNTSVVTAPTGSILSTTDPFVIGNRANDDARVWDGMISDFAIWDDVLLSIAEAQAIYMGASPENIRPGLLREYVSMKVGIRSARNAAPQTIMAKQQNTLVPRAAGTKQNQFTSCGIGW